MNLHSSHPTAQSTPAYIRVRQALERYSISRSYFFALVKAGKLPPGSAGGRMRFWRVDELDEAFACFLAEQASPSKAA
jgi:predicted DNA-binding transcriptional regulator AlpA